MTKIFRQRVTGDFCDRSRHFHTGRSATDDDKGHRRFACLFIVDFLRVFECHQNPTPKFNRVFKTLQSWSQLFPIIMSEVGMTSASREN